jgi:hypothetical protein
MKRIICLFRGHDRAIRPTHLNRVERANREQLGTLTGFPVYLMNADDIRAYNESEALPRLQMLVLPRLQMLVRCRRCGAKS